MLGGHRPPVAVATSRFVLPVALVLFATGVAMGYFFWRTTGSPLRMPYQVNRATYGAAPYFIWQTPGPQPVYRHGVMRDFYVNVELAAYQRMLSIGGFVRETGIKLLVIWGFYIGPALTIPLLSFPWIVRDRRIRWLLGMGGVSLAGTALVTFFIPHYVAAITGIIIAVVVQGMRHLRVWSPGGKPVGMALVRAMVVICALMVPVHAWVLGALGRGPLQSMGAERARVLARLEVLPQKQLVLVRYRPDHDPLQEWVYNGADIDGSKVVWAHDMGSEKNEELIHNYEDRRVWIIEADERPAKLESYQATMSGDARQEDP
jgi:hypothetical protein